MAKSITYVGLDVHKDTIAVALAEAGLREEVREYGKIAEHAGCREGVWLRSWHARARLAVLL